MDLQPDYHLPFARLALDQRHLSSPHLKPRRARPAANLLLSCPRNPSPLAGEGGERVKPHPSRRPERGRGLEGSRLLQIGRASCRERGCQYVEIWVGAVTYKK